MLKVTKIVSFIVILTFITSSCSNRNFKSSTGNKRKFNDCLQDSLSALHKGQKLLIEKYDDIDTTNYAFKAELVGDSIWHISVKSRLFVKDYLKDSIPPNIGSRRVLINKHSCEVIAFYIAR